MTVLGGCGDPAYPGGYTVVAGVLLGCVRVCRQKGKACETGSRTATGLAWSWRAAPSAWLWALHWFGLGQSSLDGNNSTRTDFPST